MEALLAYIAQIIFLLRKEVLALVKDPSTRALLVAPAFAQALLFGYGATYDLTHVPYVVVEQSGGAEARELLSRLDGTGVFERVETLRSTAEIAERINSGTALFAITIPSDFEQRLAGGRPASIQLILDGRNSTTAGSAAAYVAAVVNAYNQSRGASTPITIERRAWYNPNLESRWTLMVGLIGALSMLQTLLLSALSVAREREQGTFDQLLVTPLTPTQILIGKALPPIFIGVLQSTIIFLIILLWFKIPIHGSVWLLYLGLFAFTGASVGIGLSISAVSLSMQQAMLYTFMLIMPLMLLSGMLTPVRNMPEILQVVTYANPLRFGIDIVRRVYLEGAGFAEVATSFIPLLAVAGITLPLSAWLFRNRLS